MEVSIKRSMYGDIFVTADDELTNNVTEGTISNDFIKVEEVTVDYLMLQTQYLWNV